MRCGVVSFVVAFAVGMGWCAQVAGQATRPAGAWEQAVNQLADAVRGEDVNALLALLEHAPMLRSFGSDAIQAPERLLGTTSGTQLLSAHAYLKPPTTLATDLASHLQNASGVAEELREKMTPPDDTAAARANRTAADWIAQLLEPEKDQPVAVIVLWPEPRSDSFFSVPSRPLFLLAKGELVNDRYVFRHIIFGDPLEAAR